MDNKQEFKWNDALVSECVSFCHEINKSGTTQVKYWGKDLVQEFIKSKEHKVEEKRIGVSHFRKHDTFLGNHSDSWFYQFCSSKPIPEEKYEAVKQAIERELNNDTVVVPQWYTRSEIYDWLLSKNYSKEIAFELADYWFTDLQGAFKKGWEKAQYELNKKSDTVVEDKIVFDGERVNKYLIDEFGQTGKTEPLRFYSHKKYSQSEVDAIRKEAFCSGFFKGWYNGCFEEDKAYSNKIGEARYEEWLSSLTPTNNEPLSDSIPTLEINIPHAQKVIKEVLSTEKYGNVPTGFFTPQESKQDSKGWEVFSYQENDEAKTVWTIDKVQSNQWRNEFQNPDYWCNTSPTLTGTKFSLFQVRRLSDGEVFSVGDEEDFVGKITAIRIDAKYSGGIGLTGDCRTRAIETAIKLPLTEQPKPRQMWNKHTGIHDENECCKHLGCEYYNPINITHE